MVDHVGPGDGLVESGPVADVAEACLRAAETPRSRGAVLNIGGPPERVPTVVEQVRALIAHAGSSSPVVCIPAGVLRTAARGLHLVGLSPIVPEHYLLADSNFILDIGAARSTLGWEPANDNVTMMNAAYDWYVAAGPAIRPAPHPLLRLLDVVRPLVRAASGAA